MYNKGGFGHLLMCGDNHLSYPWCEDPLFIYKDMHLSWCDLGWIVRLEGNAGFKSEAKIGPLVYHTLSHLVVL